MAEQRRKVELVGHVVRDPALREVNDTKVLGFVLAANSRRRRDQTAVFADVSVWGRRGEGLFTQIRKGDYLLVEGDFALKAWTDDEGRARPEMKVDATDVVLLGAKKDSRVSADDAA